MPTVSPAAVFDSHATDNGGFDANNAVLWVGSNSAITNAQAAILFENVQLDKGRTLDSALLTLTRKTTLGSTQTLIMDIGAHKAANSSAPSGNADQLGRTMTTARVSVTFPNNTAVGSSTYDIKNVLQEIVNQSGWVKGNNVLIILRSTGGTGGGAGTNGGRRLDFGSLQSDAPATLGVAYQLPSVTAQMTLSENALDTLQMTASPEAAEPPPPVVAAMSLGEVVGDSMFMYAGRGDLTRHTLQRVERVPAYSHAFITASGEMLYFAARFPRALGEVRSETLGSEDDAWYPASGLTTRVPSALTFRAYLPDVDDPEAAGDRFKRLLADVRQLVMPNGFVWGLHYAQYGPNSSDTVIDVIAQTTGAEPRHPLLSGTIAAAFPTEASTPELPVYAIDPAGGITAPVAADGWDTGAVAFAVRLGERTRQSLWALGTAIDAQGDAPDGSLSLSWSRDTLHTHLRGEAFRLREQFLGPFGSLLVLVLRWTRYSATLTTRSDFGNRTWELPIGEAKPLSEGVVSAGVRSDGVGSGSFIAFGRPFLSVRPGAVPEMEGVAERLYRALTKPGLSWEVMPPDVSIALSRADDKALELAPGESVTFDLAVARSGGYTGPLEFAVTADTLTATYTVPEADLYRVTLTAPVGTPETAYTLRRHRQGAGRG